MKNKLNVLYIMSDDHASNAVSAYNSILSEVFETPNIDRLGREGLKLDSCFSTNPVCTPARASIMTGQYGHINGVKTLDDSLDQHNSPNLVKLFKENGYQTSIFGKWHLHCLPEHFDEYKILRGVGGQGTYQDPEFLEKEAGETQYNGYVTDIITDMTVNYINTELDTEKPFFMMCHHKAPHDFWEFAERHRDLFDGIDIPVPDSLFEDRSHRSVATKEFGSSVTPRSKVRNLYNDFSKDTYVTGKLITPQGATFEEKGILAYQKYLKDYLRTVASIDDSVKVVLDTLDKKGILDDTLVIYTSDQGMYLGEHDFQDKRWCYEEGLKIPFLMRCPKVLPVGKTNSNLMSNIDIAPTLLDFCDIKIPEEMQGKSQKSVLVEENKEDINEGIYFRYWIHLSHGHHNPAHFGIRTKKYKLFFFYAHPLNTLSAAPTPTPQGFELYDLEKDPLEVNNVYDKEEYQDIVIILKDKLREMRAYYKDLDIGFEDIVNF